MALDDHSHLQAGQVTDQAIHLVIGMTERKSFLCSRFQDISGTLAEITENKKGLGHSD